MPLHQLEDLRDLSSGRLGSEKLQTINVFDSKKHDILNLTIRTSVNFNDTCRCGREQQAGEQAGWTIRTAIGHCRYTVSSSAHINAGQPPTRLRGMPRIWCGCQLQAGKNHALMSLRFLSHAGCMFDRASTYRGFAPCQGQMGRGLRPLLRSPFQGGSPRQHLIQQRALGQQSFSS